MNNEDRREPTAHEALNEIADRLNASILQASERDRLYFASRQQPPAATATTFAAPPPPVEDAQFAAEHTRFAAELTRTEDASFSAEDAQFSVEDTQYAAEDSQYSTEDTQYSTDDAQFAEDSSVHDAPQPDEAAASVNEEEVSATTPGADPEPAAPQRAASYVPDAPEARERAAAPTPLVLARSEPSRARTVLLNYFPMLIAVMALGVSIFQGYLFHRSMDLVERDAARGEYIRTCREAIETYYQVKQKVSVLMPAADRGNVAGASRVTEANRLEAQAAIAKFGGLGTYLANFQDPAARARYTELMRALTGIFENARATPLAEIDRIFAPADKLFTSMNDDCLRQARAMRL